MAHRRGCPPYGVAVVEGTGPIPGESLAYAQDRLQELAANVNADRIYGMRLVVSAAATHQTVIAYGTAVKMRAANG